ncbi:SRPBCC family protein [Aquincola tertiaricarbonis]|uniref:SRPBCC family protein n=1 Tax=Aquincola tertiaricarbonis TaxID=391953 RepID=UPI000A98AE64|nr:SRPBCC family protein [Aquincola tertiaricarbonis]
MGNSVAMQRQRSLRPSGPSPVASVGGPMQVPGWVPLALGVTAIVAGLARRKKAPLVLIGLASATAVAVARGVQLRRDGGPAVRKGRGKALANEPEVERSITIAMTADALYQRWCDPKTLPQIMSGFAIARPSGDGRMHWRVAGPLGHAYEWDSETVNDRPGEGIGWRSLHGAAVPNEGSVRFRPGPADRGTVATLRFRFDPPGGVLGEAAVKLLARTPLNLAADGVLRRFKSLVETGEIPTTERQPAARADTR